MSTIVPHFLVPIIYVLLALFFPYQSTASGAVVPYTVLKSNYQKWETFAVIPLFIFTIAMTYGFGKLFNYWFVLIDKTDDSLYKLVPANWTWFIPAFLLSLGLIAVPMSILYRAILGNDGYSEYLHYTNLKHGFDGLKIMKPVFVLFALLGSISLFLLRDYSVKLYNDKIEINSFLTLKKKEIGYKDIKAIHFVYNKAGKKDELVPYPHYVIVFDDDMKWIADNEHELQTKNNEQLINYLKKRAVVKTDTIDVYRN